MSLSKGPYLSVMLVILYTNAHKLLLNSFWRCANVSTIEHSVVNWRKFVHLLYALLINKQRNLKKLFTKHYKFMSRKSDFQSSSIFHFCWRTRMTAGLHDLEGTSPVNSSTLNSYFLFILIWYLCLSQTVHEMFTLKNRIRQLIVAVDYKGTLQIKLDCISR